MVAGDHSDGSASFSSGNSGNHSSRSGSEDEEEDEYGRTSSDEYTDDDDDDYDSADYSTGSGSYSDGSYSDDEEEEPHDRPRSGRSWWPFSRPAVLPVDKEANVPAGQDESTKHEADDESEGTEGDTKGRGQNIISVVNDEAASAAERTQNKEENGEEEAVYSDDEDEDDLSDVDVDDAPYSYSGNGTAPMVQTEEDPVEDDAEEKEDGYGNNDDADHGDSSDEDVEEDEDEQPSLSERRSLLSLAAEHDRVDILHALLSGDDMMAEDDNKEKTAGKSQQVDPTLVELLLNNRPCREHIFLPPLHVAVAAGSTRAVAALLRLGGDPSLRPAIPRGYVPPWVEGTAGGGTTSGHYGTPNNSTVRSWRKFDGMSAWELAFGISDEAWAARMAASAKSGDGAAVEGGTDSDEDDAMSPPSPPKRSSWFFGRSSSTKSAKEDAEKVVGNAAISKVAAAEAEAESNKMRRRRSALNIAPSKLEGIRHAFTAEALRAIGSDEVERLTQLVDAGMDKSIEVGDKNLLVWAEEMGAPKCAKMLSERWGSEEKENEPQDEDGQASQDATVADLTPTFRADDSAPRPESSPANASKSSNGKVPPPPPPQSVRALRLALEESESLTPALSLMLDNLAEEVSITQGLLLSEAGSKASLVSHVRSLKSRKAQCEEELQFWMGKLEDRQYELDDRLRRISSLFGPQERNRVWKAVEERIHVKEVEEKKRSQRNLANCEDSEEDDMEGATNQDDEQLQATLQGQLAASQTKVAQLRASVADLAEENDRNLAAIQKRGLSGAVKLACRLREELHTVEDDLREVRSAETGLRMRSNLVSAELEARSRVKAAVDALPTPKQSASSEGLTSAERNAEQPNVEALPQEEEREEEVPLDEDDLLVSDDAEFQKYVAEQAANEMDIRGEQEETKNMEISNNHTESDSEDDGVLVEKPVDDNDAGSLELPPESIKAGDSTAVIVRPSDAQGFLSSGLWAILKRIVGFSRVAAQESVEEVVQDLRSSIADVMIV